VILYCPTCQRRIDVEPFQWNVREGTSLTVNVEDELGLHPLRVRTMRGKVVVTVRRCPYRGRKRKW
jgi:hypothetical protein